MSHVWKVGVRGRHKSVTNSRVFGTDKRFTAVSDTDLEHSKCGRETNSGRGEYLHE